MLKLTDSDVTRAMWPHAFEATFEARPPRPPTAPGPAVAVVAAAAIAVAGYPLSLRQASDAQLRRERAHAPSALSFPPSQVTLRSSRLKLELRTLNSGDAPFTFTAAMHTYLEVVDVNLPNVRVTGLQGKKYLDKVPDPKKPVEKARFVSQR